MGLKKIILIYMERGNVYDCRKVIFLFVVAVKVLWRKLLSTKL